MTEHSSKEVFEILYVEDCPEDVAAMKRAIATSDFEVNLTCNTTLEEAQANLQNLIKASGRSNRPSLIFLDLRLHGSSGMDLLRQLKSHQELKTIPVIILSASEQDSDLTECCSLGATAYIKKPFKLAELKNKIHSSLGFWLGVAHHPRQWIHTKTNTEQTTENS